jgi:uncharacterized protein (DUF1697 family)
LKACFEKAGFENISTYINSGNVIFDSAEKDILKLQKKCEEFLKDDFGFPIGLAIIDVSTLQDGLKNAPAWWGNDEDAKHNAIFVISPATAEEITREAGQIKPAYEKMYVHGGIIFWSAPIKTYSRTRLSKIVGTKAYQNITIRNANTAKKLLELAVSMKED